MTIILQIIGFHNCYGCSQKVRKAARRIGVELVELDRETGTVTIETAEPPEVIRYALERELKKSVVIMSRDLVPENRNTNYSAVPHRVPPNGALDLHELGEVMFRLAQVWDGVEITNSNTFRINPPVVRLDRGGGVRIRDADDEYAPPRPPPRSPPWAATEPSAPLMSTEEQAVIGYPADYYGISTARNHDNPNGCCTII
ncbi:hypothetical protein SSX86_016838 [Deinandra increscens subsp. villosa]|uniref:HMA domain-containing protein n=1 Tax=Deinandra increscens subsp. villosa TaxID=3103831 RepID=A0AAP0GTQ6_9ASTR